MQNKNSKKNWNDKKKLGKYNSDNNSSNNTAWRMVLKKE